jgi:hypothetical protein
MATKKRVSSRKRPVVVENDDDLMKIEKSVEEFSVGYDVLLDSAELLIQIGRLPEVKEKVKAFLRAHPDLIDLDE